MFKNILEFFKGKDFLNQVLEDFKAMLDDAEEMFRSVCKKLIYNEDDPELKDKIYSIDKKINELQKDIRKRIVEHLAIQPSVNIPTSLLLMSVVKDAERLGDYSKNLYEVTTLLTNPIDPNTFKNLFGNIDNEILDFFKETKDAFIQSDENKAISSWDYQKAIKIKCEETIKKLSNSNLSVNEAVCFTLMTRYFKRLTGHLTNIATSVILPIDKLDYYDERFK
ncbi:MAG: hypothetical protein KAI91_01890 [Candidatus Omnitrophica bacterium]|nr:hypothetical protein [Candidatus Omnitrophota bacterium]MCK5393060.1 hypothetical protein [Candidatus Omnitrophota bacterium]